MAKTTKLHEIIAIEGDLQATANKVIDEATNTFSKKADHFMEQITALEMHDENRQQENTREHKAMVTTVDDKLSYVGKHLIRYYDAISRKERTNQDARADLVVDGGVLVPDMPGTLLLGLESRLKQFRTMCEAIPTLQPGIVWVPDETQTGNVFKMEQPRTRFKTEKIKESKVIVQPTKEFPAQVDTWTVDKPCGSITDQVWCGMLSSAGKSDLIGRIDKLLRAVKKARQRANEQEVVDLRVGQAIVNYILG